MFHRDADRHAADSLEPPAGDLRLIDALSDFAAVTGLFCAVLGLWVLVSAIHDVAALGNV